MDTRFNSIFFNFAVGLIFYAITKKIFPERKKLAIVIGFVGYMVSAIGIGILRSTLVNS